MFHSTIPNLPIIAIFVITWLLLRLIDELVAWRPMPGPVPIYSVIRIIIILVALILCLV